MDGNLQNERAKYQLVSCDKNGAGSVLSGVVAETVGRGNVRAETHSGKVKCNRESN